MKYLSEELRYALNLPLPPVYTLRQDNSHLYKVPEFFGYESPSTRWILAMLTNKSNLKRLIKCSRTHEDIFSRYYQVPDRPVDLMPGDYSLETPAYHQQTVLYLTPLALALYMKQVYAVEILLDLKDETGRKLVHPAEPCFVQRVYKKGARRISNELSNTLPILIAIRRGFYEGVSLLLECGFAPQKQLTIIYRMAFKESVHLFKDVVDYMVELLRDRPCLNVTKFIKIMTDTGLGLTSFDMFVYDLELDENNRWDYVSIFRRICRTGLSTRYFLEESAIQLINILEQIQVMGYFGGVSVLKVYYNGTPPISSGKPLSKKTIEELQSERISVIMDKIPTIIKANREDLFHLSPEELSVRMNFDYQICLGNLFFWYQRCQVQDRCGHYMKLSKLMSKIIMDTRIIEDFFVKSDEALAAIFSEWCLILIKPATIYDFRIRMQDYILFTDHLCITFINRYDKIPSVLLRAPILYGRDPSYSPVVRELLQLNKSTLSDTGLSANENNNQNNRLASPLIFNLFDKENRFSGKFIPANHIRHFSLDKCINNSSIVNNNKNNNYLSDQPRSEMDPDPLGTRYRRRSSVMGNGRKSENRQLVKQNCSNSLESLVGLLQNEEKNNSVASLAGCKSFNEHSYSRQNLLSSKNRFSSSMRSNCNLTSQNVKPPSYHQERFRTKSSMDFCNRGFKPIQTRCQLETNESLTSDCPSISDDVMKSRLKVFLASNPKFRDIKLDSKLDKVPLKSLRPEVNQFKSGDSVIKQIQSKISTQLDCLSNNLVASSIIKIMQELLNTRNSKMSKSKFIDSLKSEKPV